MNFLATFYCATTISPSTPTPNCHNLPYTNRGLKEWGYLCICVMFSVTSATNLIFLPSFFLIIFLSSSLFLLLFLFCLKTKNWLVKQTRITISLEDAFYSVNQSLFAFCTYAIFMAVMICWILNPKSYLGKPKNLCEDEIRIRTISQCYQEAFSSILSILVCYSLLFFMAKTAFELISLCLLLGILCNFYRRKGFLIIAVNSQSFWGCKVLYCLLN